MKPQEQKDAIAFLEKVIPSNFYVIANGDHIEIHQIDDVKNIQSEQLNLPFEKPTHLPPAWWEEDGGY